MATYDSQELIEKLLRKMRARIRRQFGLIVLQMKNETSLADLAEFLSVRDYQSPLRMLDAAAERLATTLNSAFMLSTEEFVEAMAEKLGLVISFDQFNPAVVEFTRQNKFELIRNFTREQTEATRQAILRGVQEGLNPREMARAFRDSIGLTKNQERAVANFRKLLEQNDPEALLRQLRDRRFDRTVARAIDFEGKLSKSEIKRMVDRYRDRMLKFRSETIARTEALPMVHKAHDEAVRQAVDKGVIEKSKIKRTWKSAHDDRVRDPKTGAKTSHRTMHNQVRGFGEAFVSGAGNLLMYPGEPNAPAVDRIQCRCVVATRISL